LKKPVPGFLPAIGWLIISTVLLTIPGTSFPKEDWLDKIWLDKWVHLGMFTILVILWCWGGLRARASIQKRKIFFTMIAILGIVYGLGMELVQHYFIPNRSFDTGDLLADAAGCMAGLIYSVRTYIKK